MYVYILKFYTKSNIYENNLRIHSPECSFKRHLTKERIKEKILYEAI